MLEKAFVWKNVISFSSKCDQAELIEWPALEQKGTWGIISPTSRKLVPVWYEQSTGRTNSAPSTFTLMKVMSGNWKLWQSESLDSLSMSNCKPMASWHLGLKVAWMSKDQNSNLFFKKLTSCDKVVSSTRQNRWEQSKHHVLEAAGLRHKRQSSIRFKLCEWPAVWAKNNLGDKQLSYSTLDITSNHFKNHSVSLHSLPSSSICFFL